MNLLDRMLSALVLSGFLCLTGRAEEATTKVPDPQPAAAGGLPLMAGPASGSVIDELFGKYLPRLGYSYDAFNTVGREGGLSAFQMFVPIYESGTSTQLLFSDSRFLLFDNGGTVGANLGLGGRLFSESINRTLGGYVYWDYSDTGRASFRQVSGGLETLGDKVDARANFYLPVGRDRKVVDQVIVPSAEPTFQNHYLLVGGGQGTRSTEQALYGFDTEAGYKIVALEGLELRAFAGMYHYQSDDATTQAWGPRGRLEARLRDTMAMGVSLQNDRIFGTTVNLNVMLSYPRLSGRSYSDGPSAPLPASDRLGDPIIRQQQISVQRNKETFTVAGSPVIDPLTGKPYYFLHVAPGGNSDGSVESPYGTLAAAFADPRFSQGNLVVYDRTNGTYMGNVQLAPGTRLLSSGPVQVLDTTQGTVLLPHSGSQANGAFMPRIQGSIRLANNTMLSGFDVVGQGRAAIFANPGEPLRNVIIRNNRISGGLAAIQLPSLAGRADIHANDILGVGGNAIELGMMSSDPGQIFITDNRVANATGDAMTLRVQNAAGPVQVAVKSNTVDNVDGNGISVTSAGKNKVDLEVEGNTIREATGSGVQVVTDGSSSGSLKAVIQNNTVARTGPLGEGGIALLTTSAPGQGNQVQATIIGNEVLNTFGTGVTVRTSGLSSLSLELYGNKASSPYSGFGFLLDQVAGSVFQAVEPDALNARNQGGILTSGTIQPVSSSSKP